MAVIKNRGTMFVVMRHTFDGCDVACACSDSLERAEELEGEYTQTFLDKGYVSEEFYYYVCSVTYYS